MYFTPASFIDAAGGSDGADITYKIEGNGGLETIFIKDGNNFIYEENFNYNQFALHGNEHERIFPSVC